MKAGLVDAVLVTYGGADDLAAAIAALQSQGPVVGRVLVIDNASPDATAAVAASLDGVELIVNDANLGYAAAMNQAFRLTTAPYLLSLNADCVLGAGYLDACVAVLEADAAVAGVTGVLRFEDGRIDSTGIALDGSDRASDRDRGAKDPSAGDPFGVSGAAAVFRREALVAVGPSPWWEWLFVYWDDVELAWRLRARGYRFACAPTATATHRRGSDSANPDFVEGQSLRNRLGTVARHRGLAGVLQPRSLVFTAFTTLRLALRHPKALRAARPLSAIRVGLDERAHDVT